jgi:pilus assembly protein TadC
VTTAAWLFGGVGLLLAGRPRPRRRRHAAAARSSKPWLLRASASVATAVVAVGILGGAFGLVVGSCAGVAVWLLVPTLVARTNPAVIQVARVPLVLDLVATVLRTGQPVPAALDWGAEVADAVLAGELRKAGALLRLGASAADAWSSLAADPRLRPVSVVAIRSADSGIRLAAAFSALATELRADAVTAATARANRAGIWVLAPLGLCFLPSFVCLGVAPVIAGIGAELLSGGGL